MIPKSFPITSTEYRDPRRVKNSADRYTYNADEELTGITQQTQPGSYGLVVNPVTTKEVQFSYDADGDVTEVNRFQPNSADKCDKCETSILFGLCRRKHRTSVRERGQSVARRADREEGASSPRKILTGSYRRAQRLRGFARGASERTLGDLGRLSFAAESQPVVAHPLQPRTGLGRNARHCEMQEIHSFRPGEGWMSFSRSPLATKNGPGAKRKTWRNARDPFVSAGRRTEVIFSLCRYARQLGRFLRSSPRSRAARRITAGPEQFTRLERVALKSTSNILTGAAIIYGVLLLSGIPGHYSLNATSLQAGAILFGAGTIAAAIRLYWRTPEHV